MDSFNDNMISLYTGKNELELLIGEKMEKYVIMDVDYLKFLITNIYNNNLLILFSLSFFSTLYFCAMKYKKDHDYILVQQSEPLKGSIINNDEKV
jgi:ABC-type uncharacterized transport system substrate-binding protein